MLQLFFWWRHTGLFMLLKKALVQFYSTPPAFKGLDTGLSEQGMEKGIWVVTGRLGIRLGGWGLVGDRVQAEGTGRRGEGETSGGLPHDCTAGCWCSGSESGCSVVLGLVWQPGWKLGQSRVLRLEFDLGWMLWRVWGQTLDMLWGTELRLGLDWETSGEKWQGWEFELFDFGWDEQSRWPLVRGFVLRGQLPLDRLSELVLDGE